MSKIRSMFGVLVTIGLMMGCASMKGAGKSPEERVAERAKAYYGALIGSKHSAAFEFFSPTFRQKTSAVAYWAGNPPFVTYVSAEIKKIECPTQVLCHVHMDVVYKDVQGVRGAPKGNIPYYVVEKWVYDKGEWWLYKPL